MQEIQRRVGCFRDVGVDPLLRRLLIRKPRRQGGRAIASGAELAYSRRNTQFEFPKLSEIFLPRVDRSGNAGNAD